MVILVIASVVLMTVDHRFQHLKMVRQALAASMYPLQVLAEAPLSLLDWSSESLSSRGNLVSENRRLKEQNLLYQSELQRLAALERENSRLRQMLDSPARPRSDKLLIAELLAVNLHPFRQQVTLNKGSRSGVEIGQPIVGAKGIMGQVIQVFPLHSVAILISDPNHAILTEVNRTGLRVLLRGTGEVDQLELRFVSPSTDIQTGDLLVSSGLDGRYPAGYPVGKVVSVTQQPGDEFLTISVEPLADLTTAREVLVLWTHGNDLEAANTEIEEQTELQEDTPALNDTSPEAEAQ